MEIPSDYLGIVYVDVDPGDAWKFKLAKEIKAAGIDIDMNKVIA
jgi:predicted nucleotide-binding protein